MNVLSVKIRS